MDSTGQWLINQPFSNDLDYKENIYSAYLMYSDSLVKKIFYKIGARVEYNTSALTMKSTDEEINREYFIPFPFAMAKFAINKEQSVSASVTRRVTRPIYSQLNPYIVVIDQITYETGNRELKPEIVDKLEVNYAFVKDKFQFRSNLFYGITNDFITQVSVFSDNKLIVTYANGNKLIKSGVDADATFKLSKYFSLNPAFSFFYSESNGNYKNTDLSANGTAWTGNLKAIIRPDKKSDIQFLINYNSPIELPQFKLDEIYYTDIAIKRNFLKNNLTLSFTVTDVFNSRQWIVNTTNSVYSVYNKSKNDTRIYWFGITYNFNSYKPTNGKVVENENEGGVIKLGQ
jgi:outer membrane receptor protein involved in Fe transport